MGLLQQGRALPTLCEDRAGTVSMCSQREMATCLLPRLPEGLMLPPAFSAAVATRHKAAPLVSLGSSVLHAQSYLETNSIFP